MDREADQYRPHSRKPDYHARRPGDTTAIILKRRSSDSARCVPARVASFPVFVIPSVRVSKMEAIPELHIDLPRLGVVRAAKGLTIVEQKSPISQIQGGDGEGHIFGDRFAGR